MLPTDDAAGEACLARKESVMWQGILVGFGGKVGLSGHVDDAKVRALREEMDVCVCTRDVRPVGVGRFIFPAAREILDAHDIEMVVYTVDLSILKRTALQLNDAFDHPGPD